MVGMSPVSLQCTCLFNGWWYTESLRFLELKTQPSCQQRQHQPVLSGWCFWEPHSYSWHVIYPCRASGDMGPAPRNPNGWWKRDCAVWFSTDWQRESGSQHASLKVTLTNSWACSLREVLCPQGLWAGLSPVSHSDSCFKPSDKSECLFLPFFLLFFLFLLSLPFFSFSLSFCLIDEEKNPLVTESG